MKFRTLEEQIAGACIHFNGVQNNTCKAGVAYSQFQGRPHAFPCLAHLNLEKVTCEKQQFPTPEEVKKQLAKKVKEEHRGHSWKGSLPCPACGTGTLHMSHAAYNGHVWGHCTTEGCLCWVE